MLAMKMGVEHCCSVSSNMNPLTLTFLLSYITCHLCGLCSAVWLNVQTPRALGPNLSDGVWQLHATLVLQPPSMVHDIMQQLQFLPLSGSTTKIVHAFQRCTC
jgi:hypothetical protein